MHPKRLQNALRIAITLGILGSALPARAHFLWAELTPGSTSVLRIRFSEQAGEATSPSLLARLKPARTWTAQGQFLTPEPAEGALETRVPEGTQVAATHQTWGVMDRSAQGRGIFLLEYYAKAAIDASAATREVRLPVEAFVRREKEAFQVQVRHQGKPARNAEIVVQRPGNANLLALRTDDAGKATFKMAGNGLYALRAQVEEARSGEHEGRRFALVRHYTTLTFHVSSAGTPSETGLSADPAAWNLLKAAHDRRWTFPQDFPGLRGEVVYNDQGRESTATFTYTPGQGVRLDVPEEALRSWSWALGQLNNVLGHRRGGDFARGDGSFPITFTADPADNPLGRQVRLNDPMHSMYRVQNRTVVEVTRTMGDTRFTITVLETDDTEDGRYLPRHFVVHYFHARTGALQKTESYSDRYVRQGSHWVPAARRVVVAENGRIISRSLQIRQVVFLSETTAQR
ncbi:MAG: DUF3386 family protein [Chloroherpetonaceae bacterium]|nr:DUF3386 family protein [Chthonomonadaceae bacterium]MDW8207833.1 DUF3386 family protein [Chloroherpetonaceae bacterium]